MLQAVSLVTFLTFKIDFKKNRKRVTFLILSQRTSILIITRWKRNKRFDESRFSPYPLSWESAGMVERIKNLFSFNFIDAEERNASLDKNIKNWILAIFRTCIIHKLTASCLRLSFHLTFNFLVLQSNHQLFLFLFLSVKQKFKVDAPMQIFPLWGPKISPQNLHVFL